MLSEYSLLIKIVDGPCYEAGVEKDASTEFRKSAPKVEYSTMIKSLAMAGRYMHGTCYVCGPPKENPAYIMMAGAKVALSYIDQEVGRLQDQIKVTEP